MNFKLVYTFGILLSFLISSSVYAQDENRLTTQVLEQERSPWGVSFFSLASQQLETINKGGANIDSYNYFSLNYRVGRGESFAFKPAFNLSSAGFNKYGDSKEMDFNWNDAYFQYAKYNIAKLYGGVDFGGQFKIYLPTSESSQERKTITRIGSWMTFEKWMGNGWELTYNFKPDYYVQSQTAYMQTIKTNKPGEGNREFQVLKQNTQAALDHYLELTKNFSRDLSLSQAVGFKHEWIHAAPSEKRDAFQYESFKISTGLGFAINPKLNFIFQVENMVSVLRPQQSFGLFRPEETQFMLFTFARI